MNGPSRPAVRGAGMAALLVIPLALALLATRGLGPRGSAGASQGENGLIAFASDRHGNFDIFTVELDGDNLTRVTDNSADDVAPSWSPDGKRIVFQSYRTGKGDIYSTKTNGTDVKRETTDGAYDGEPSYSPDGNTIAFTSTRKGSLDVWLKDVSGGATTRLTDKAADEFAPVFAPDGTRIAFTSNRDGSSDIWAMDVDGSNMDNLTETDEDADGYPSWSPDGMTILYATNRVQVTTYDVFVMNADGTDQVKVVGGSNFDGYPAWSPDGAFLVFNSNRDGTHDIWYKDGPDGATRKVTGNSSVDQTPEWQRILP